MRITAMIAAVMLGAASFPTQVALTQPVRIYAKNVDGLTIDGLTALPPAPDRPTILMLDNCL